MGVALLERVSGERAIVGYILRHDGAPLRLGYGEDQGVRLTPQVGPLRDRHHVVAPAPELDSDRRGPHLVEQEPYRRSRACSRRQAASARAASSSTRRIQAAISSGYSA